MRVALLGPANSIHLQRWACALSRRGHEVCVLSQHRDEHASLPSAVELFMLPCRGAVGYFINAWWVRRLLRAWRPDVLNAHYASGYGTTATLSGYRPVLLSVWGSDVYAFPYQGALKAWLLRRTLKRATAIASTSHAMARQVQGLLSDDRDIAVTPFGVDIGRFVPDASRRINGQLTIGVVKSLAPTYGIDLLIRAFAALLCDPEVSTLVDQCHLLIVGNGPQRESLEALAVELGIASRTEFMGAVPHAEVPAVLNRMHIYASPSRNESFGVAVIEASACALPVVVSDVGGLPEVVLDGETGLVVPCEDVGALQQALLRLVLDPALRERLGAKGRDHVAREYEWSRCVERMEAVYKKVIAKPSSR